MSFMLLYPAHPNSSVPGDQPLTPEGSQTVTHEFYAEIYPH